MSAGKLYSVASLPEEWVGEDPEAGGLWIFGARPNGWAARRKYVGHKRALVAVGAHNAAGTGWPGHGRSGSQSRQVAIVSVSLPIADVTRVDAAAESAGVTRSAWVRAAIEAKLDTK